MRITLFVRIHECLSPEQRETRYAEPLSNILEAKGIGSVIGGGTKFTAKRKFEYSYLEILVENRRKAEKIIRQFFRDSRTDVPWSLD